MSTDNIVFRNVNVTFRREEGDLTVFEKLNLEIDPTAFTVLVGKSGCGKTTLLRLIAGLEKPTAGEVILPEGFSVGMMFQEARLMPWLTCEKNVMLGLDKSKKREAEEILKMVGLQGFEKAYPAQLSGGMKQRAALARTLIRRSNLILMDEPFSALDGATRRQMQQELLKIREQTGAGVVFVTHDIEEATFLGDRIITVSG